MFLLCVSSLFSLLIIGCKVSSGGSMTVNGKTSSSGVFTSGPNTMDSDTGKDNSNLAAGYTEEWTLQEGAGSQADDVSFTAGNDFNPKQHKDMRLQVSVCGYKANPNQIGQPQTLLHCIRSPKKFYPREQSVFHLSKTQQAIFLTATGAVTVKFNSSEQSGNGAWSCYENNNILKEETSSTYKTGLVVEATQNNNVSFGCHN